MGITGVTFIQILAGDPNAALLTAANGETPQIPTSRTLVDELFQGGQDLLGVSGDTIKKINETLSEENLKHLTSMLASLDVAIAKIAQDDGIIDEATKALANINTAAVALGAASNSVDVAAKSIGADFGKLQGDVSGVIDKLDPTLDEARSAMANVSAAVEQINTSLTPAATRTIRQVGNSAADLQTLIARLRTVLAQVERDPSSFIYQQPQPVER